MPVAIPLAEPDAELTRWDPVGAGLAAPAAVVPVGRRRPRPDGGGCRSVVQATGDIDRKAGPVAGRRAAGAGG